MLRTSAKRIVSQTIIEVGLNCRIFITGLGDIVANKNPVSAT